MSRSGIARPSSPFAGRGGNIVADERDLTRAALTLITIAWRLLEKSELEEVNDESGCGLRPSIN